MRTETGSALEEPAVLRVVGTLLGAFEVVGGPNLVRVETRHVAVVPGRVAAVVLPKERRDAGHGAGRGGGVRLRLGQEHEERALKILVLPVHLSHRRARPVMASPFQKNRHLR